MPRQAIWYFPHESHFSDSKEILSIRIKHGPAGYGILMMLFEYLLEHRRIYDETILKLKDGFCLGGDKELLALVIETALSLGLLTQDDQGLIGSDWIDGIRKDREATLQVDRERKKGSTPPKKETKNQEQDPESEKENIYSYSNSNSKESGGITKIPPETNRPSASEDSIQQINSINSKATAAWKEFSVLWMDGVNGPLKAIPKDSIGNFEEMIKDDSWKERAVEYLNSHPHPDILGLTEIQPSGIQGVTGIWVDAQRAAFCHAREYLKNYKKVSVE